jgi:general secretion pathway protein J
MSCESALERSSKAHLASIVARSSGRDLALVPVRRLAAACSPNPESLPSRAALGRSLARGPVVRKRASSLPNRGARARQQGFTLLEVIVAVALFALVAALAYGGLDSVLSARAQLGEQAERLARLQFAVGQIERDVRAVAQRPVRDGFGQRQPMLIGSSTGMELSRHGYGNALEAARAEIERAAYRRVDDRLQRLRWPVLDRAPGTLPEQVELLSGVTDFRLRYFARNGREYDRWPAPRSNEALPLRIELELEVEGIGTVRRLLELPDAEARL